MTKSLFATFVVSGMLASAPVFAESAPAHETAGASDHTVLAQAGAEESAASGGAAAGSAASGGAAAGGMGGAAGLSTGAMIGIGAGAAAVVGVIAASSSSSSGTGTN